MKDSLKNIWDNRRKWFPLAKNQFPPARISSVFKNWFPLIAVAVSAGRKKLSSKLTKKIREKSFSPIVGLKDSFKNTFPLDRKTDRKIYKTWFALARKSIPTIRNEAFVEKYVSTIRKNCFFWQENLRKWFALAGKCFLLKLVPPNFNNGFQR